MSDEARTETVERETVLPAGPDEVWEALTDDDRLEEWLGDDVELDPVEGGEILVEDEDGERTGTVETVIERERLTFTWARPGEGASRVDFAIEAVPAGTRLVVTETQIAGPVALFGGRWDARLLQLGRAVLLVAA
jgi:uncharacterized protein YndB with AHSA1/START domain